MLRRLLALAALSVACAPLEPPISQLIGPDGARVYHVSCAHSEAHCFQLAGESCPFGYDYASTPERNLLVRCKAAMAPNPYLAFSDPPRPLQDRNPYVEKLLPNPYSPALPGATTGSDVVNNPYSPSSIPVAPVPSPVAPAPSSPTP